MADLRSQNDQPLLGVATRADFGSPNDEPEGVEVFGRRFSFPFTIVFQGFLVLALTAIAVTVLILFRTVTLVVVDEVRKHYLSTAADEMDDLITRRFRLIPDAAAFAAATSRFHVLMASNDQLIHHAEASIRLYNTLRISDVVVVEENGGAAACEVNLTSTDDSSSTESDTTGSSSADQPSIEHGGVEDLRPLMCASLAPVSNDTQTWAPVTSVPLERVYPLPSELIDSGAAPTARIVRRWCFGLPRHVQRTYHRSVLAVSGASVLFDSCNFFDGEVGAASAARISITQGSLAEQIASMAPAGVDVSLVSVDGLASGDPDQITSNFDIRGDDDILVLSRTVPIPAVNLVASYSFELSTETAATFDLSLAVMISVSVGFLFATSVAAALALRIVLAPFAQLREDMEAASRLSLEGLREHRSVIIELDDMLTTFTQMVARLRSYKPLIAELRQTSVLLRRRAMSIDSLGSTEVNTAVHTVRVQLTYVTKKMYLVKSITTFDHAYRDGDTMLLEKFVDACRANVGAHRFEPVMLTVEEGAQQVGIGSNRHLEEVFTHCAGTLHVRMRKNARPKLLSPITLLVDLLGTVFNVAVCLWIAFGPFEAIDRVGMGVFAGFYAFVILVNVGLCLWLLKQGQKYERFRDWLSQAATEVPILLLVGSQNTSHIHFLWSQWTIAGALHFNAPRVMEVWRKAVSLSYFGFVFGDLGQVAFKLYRLTRGTGGDGFMAFVGLSLALSLASIVLHMPKKIAHFVMSRKSSDITDDFSRPAAVEDPAAGAGGDEDFAVEMPRRRPRWGHFRSLSARRVTVLLIRIPQARVRSAARFALECSFIYSATFKHVKSNRGTVLYFHAYEIAACFNNPLAVEQHFPAAVYCARDILADVKREYGVTLHATIASEALPVGSLGTATRKSQQCFAPWSLMRRIAVTQAALGIEIACTNRSQGAIDAPWDGTLVDIDGVDFALRVAPKGHEEEAAAKLKKKQMLQRFHREELSEEQCRQRLMALLAPFGFATGGVDVERTSAALRRYLVRLLRKHNAAAEGADDDVETSSTSGADGSDSSDSDTSDFAPTTSTAMRSSRFIAGLDLDDL